MRVEFGVLGEICARVDGQAVDLGPQRQRCVLGVLLADVNRPVSADQLVDRVWGADAPQRAAETLRSYLSRLRVAVPAAGEWGIRRRSGGYLLEIDEAAVDLHRFRRLADRARAGEDATAAVALYEQALGLWRGDAFADLGIPWLTGLRHMLQAERFAVQLDCHDVRLRRGEAATLLAGLTALAAVQPLDERLAGQLVLALYRSGRQADALEHYERMRRRLADDLGADPGPALQRLHRQILTGDPALTETAAPSVHVTTAPPVLRQLPAPPPFFTGRSRELAALDRALDTRGEAGRTVVISAIGGGGGMGKTWLALHWAHRNIAEFPDGQLHVNLRGFDPSGSPMPPEVAVRTFLDALAVAPSGIPAELDAQAALYRGLVADRRMLIVLDNARDTAQIAPLLPGGSSCTVLVTSRHQLTGLVTGHGAHPITLDVLEPAEAQQVLTRHLGTGRVGAEPEAVAELLDHAAGLPLALGIIAARAAMRPGLPLSVLTKELGRDYARLDSLDAGEATANLRAVFSWSYRTLTSQAARLFRLLGIHPGPDIAEPSAASLAGLTLTQVRPLLAELARAHLITEHSAGRYAFHDLLRAYATEQAHSLDTPDERRTALHRVLDHYVHTAHTAALLLYPHRHPITPSTPREGVTPTGLADHQQAMAWFTDQHAVLVAAVHEAADLGFATHAWQLAWALVTYFDQQGHWRDLLSTQSAALDVTRREGDRLGQAHAHSGLVRACTRLGRHDDARASLDRALALFTELGDRIGQANTHRGLGWLLEAHDRHGEALGHARQAHDLYREAGHRAGLAHALNAIGWYHSLLGDHRQALVHCERALELHQELDHRQGQAATWDTMGHAHHHLGDHAKAADCYQHALRLFREVADRYNEADTLIRLGDTHHAVGDRRAAGDAWERALEVLDELGHAGADQVRGRLKRLRRT
ncbi:BTAD domain-containing putative transcriptional regulator [Actinomadura sp. DC4]|uniref:AfsR/SARP family transcriptional regulator n=1 Tax=Actinomadura sp. DC4 TaxID=3055069 RepID=UPI0025AEEA4B|nr:BTAD domain-containing putative transcriptional regulator [Actinomadura sp. DC4]MDN3354460.1 BTAD domain-containing putative transcriptional regulator [Actinomadura sp. DC4]